MLNQEDKLNFWLSLIRMQLRMQSSVSDQYSIFCKEFLYDCELLEPQFRKYLDKIIRKLDLDKEKVNKLLILELSNPERNNLLLD